MEWKSDFNVVTLLKIGCGVVGIHGYNHAATTAYIGAMSATEARKARFILAERRWRVHEAPIFVAVLGYRRLASIPASAHSATTVFGAIWLLNWGAQPG